MSEQARMWRDQAREIVRKAKGRVGRDGWPFVGEAIQDAIIDSEVMSVILGWASMATVRKNDDTTDRHMAECIIELRRAVVVEIDAERGR